jgi:Lon-like protease
MSSSAWMALEGESVTSRAELRARIQRRRVGDEVRLEVAREGQQASVDLPLIESAAEPGRPIIGIGASDYLLDANLPFPVEIDTRNRVGPSGGLLYGLALLDAVTAGDLAGGRRIAGTGTIALDGRVGPIGGVREKVIAAEREQAEVFLAPRENAHAAAREATGMRVIAVGTFEDAVTALDALACSA